MRFYVGTRVGRVYVGTRLPMSALPAIGVVYIALTIAGALGAFAMFWFVLLMFFGASPWGMLLVPVIGAAVTGVMVWLVRRRRRRIIPAGWYQDPASNDHWRWWDGKEWSQRTRSKHASLAEVLAEFREHNERK
jgi:hypothetical protein